MPSAMPEKQPSAGIRSELFVQPRGRGFSQSSAELPGGTCGCGTEQGSGSRAVASCGARRQPPQSSSFRPFLSPPSAVFRPDLAGWPCNGCAGRVICAKRAVPQKRPFIEIGSGWAALPEPTETLGAQHAPISRPPATFRDWGRGWAAVSRPVVCPTVRPAPLLLSRKRACISDPGKSPRGTGGLCLQLPARVLNCCLVGHSLPASRQQAALGPDPGLVTKPSRWFLVSSRPAAVRISDPLRSTKRHIRHFAGNSPRTPAAAELTSISLAGSTAAYAGNCRTCGGTEPHVPLPPPMPPSLTSR